ncbi:NAD(P)/FAD-dependent oxidoreductase [Chengkuizengella sp. SCS-71B]|uniref:NAD(P)/FAD-dependent oxidoreductase n=1 Tax=Chengkuizengella sp. SCS-71B TaxID=3115290 RepID=UPI0032C2221D
MKELRNLFDIVIVGGGPAGLSAALVLGRSKRKVMLIDDNKPRHNVTYESHGYLTRDGITPHEFKNISRNELAKYKHVELMNEQVVHVEKKEKHFETITKNGVKLYSLKILFATGVTDHLPHIDGLKEIYGRSAFPCPYCDGWEFRDQPLAVIGNSDRIFEYTRSVQNWSSNLVLFTNGSANLNMEQKKNLVQHQITIIENKIKHLNSENGKLQSFQLENGKLILRTAAFIEGIKETQSCKIPEKLGCRIDENDAYITKQNGLTDVSGLYIIGDAKNLFSGLIKSASEGYCAGVSINSEIIEENW